MSKTNTSPSMLAVVFHTFMVLITGGVWLIPLGIYIALKYMNK